MVDIENDLRECHLSTQLIDDFHHHWKKSWQDFSYCLLGGETCYSGQSRAIRILSDLGKQNYGKTILLSTHGNLISLILNKIDPSFKAAQAAELRNPDLFALNFSEGILEWDKAFNGRKIIETFSTHSNETPIRRSPS